MGTIYLSKEELKILHDLVDDKLNIGQGDYSDDEWKIMENLYHKVYVSKRE